MATRFETLHPDAPAAAISAILKRDGILTFESLGRRADVVALARRLVNPWQHRDAGADAITTISDRGPLSEKPGFAGFGTSELSPHTESSAMAVPPRLLLLACATPAVLGGESLVVDGAAVYADLAADPEVIGRLRQPRSVQFATGRWGSIFTSTADGHLALRLRLDGLAQFTAPVLEVLPLLVDAIHRHMRELPLTAGEGFLLDNRRVLHGRRAFAEDRNRTMYRVLGDPAQAIDLPTGFAPPATAPARALRGETAA